MINNLNAALVAYPASSNKPTHFTKIEKENIKTVDDCLCYTLNNTVSVIEVFDTEKVFIKACSSDYRARSMDFYTETWIPIDRKPDLIYTIELLDTIWNKYTLEVQTDNALKYYHDMMTQYDMEHPEEESIND